MSQMRAIGWPRAGSKEPPRVYELDVPVPGPGQVLVKVVMSAVNRGDITVSSGQFAGRFIHARVSPLIVGYDFSGTVEGGPGIGDLAVGEEVFGFLPYAGSTRQGAFSEFVVVDRSTIVRKPAGVPHELAAAAATPGLTALQFLRDVGRLEEGGKVLIIGAAGGVGSLAVGVAKRLGAHVTAVCSTYAVDYVRSLGPDVVVDRRTQDPRELSGPLDVVFDVSAAYTFLAFREQIAAHGAFISTLPSASVFLGKALAAFSGKRSEFGSVKPSSADLEQLAAWLESGLRAPIDSRFAAKDLAAALRHVADGRVTGRVVVQVDGGFRDVESTEEQAVQRDAP